MVIRILEKRFLGSQGVDPPQDLLAMLLAQVAPEFVVWVG